MSDARFGQVVDEIAPTGSPAELYPVGKQQRLSSQVALSLRSYIRERNLQAGDKLPGERDLASALAVSRHVVREAKRILEQQGLVSVDQGKETVILQRPDGLGHELPLTVPFSVDQETSALEARAIFEAGLADCLVDRATEADLDELQAVVVEMRRRVLLGHPGNEDDLAFHARLHACTRNATLVQMGRLIVLTNMRRRLLHVPVTSLLEAPEEVYPDEHAEIVELIRSRDTAGLRRLLRMHPYPMIQRNL